MGGVGGFFLSFFLSQGSFFLSFFHLITNLKNYHSGYRVYIINDTVTGIFFCCTGVTKMCTGELNWIEGIYYEGIYYLFTSNKPIFIVFFLILLVDHKNVTGRSWLSSYDTPVPRRLGVWGRRTRKFRLLWQIFGYVLCSNFWSRYATTLLENTGISIFSRGFQIREFWVTRRREHFYFRLN